MRSTIVNSALQQFNSALDLWNFFDEVLSFRVGLGTDRKIFRLYRNRPLQELQLGQRHPAVHQLLRGILIFVISANIDVQMDAVLKIVSNPVPQNKLDYEDGGICILANLAHTERDLSFVVR